MKNCPFPRRHVHLDFHTSPAITGIGSRFSKQGFQEALALGKVESITVFAKCHHGLCYYPTKVGKRHPHLSFDLVGEEISAAHEIGVKAPVYITAGWSAGDAEEHPEWVMKRRDGTAVSTQNFKTEDPDAPLGHCAWQLLCLNDGAYAHHIYEITEEICQRYPVLDGLFYDICTNGKICFCEDCLSGMREMGLDPDKDADATEYFKIKHRAFMEKCTAILKKHHPDATIFFNGTVGQYTPEYHAFDSQYEMENLPTAWGGYNTLALRAKFFSHMGKPVVGMTGKFHRDWGEFGGFKTKEALAYEVAAMSMYGAAASIGDHLHPDGEMEKETYRNIGYAYGYAERIAPYSFGGKIASRLGLYPSSRREDYEANEGISSMLLEAGLDYDVVYKNNFSDFDTVILPAGARLDAAACDLLSTYLAKGGGLFFEADALTENGRFALDLGITYLGAPTHDNDYILAKEISAAPILCNAPAHRVRVGEGEIQGEVLPPYFNRTLRHYCGHKNTPHDKNAERMPAIVKRGRVVYTAHPLSRQYFEYGSIYHKRIFLSALASIYTDPVLTVTGLPSQGRVSLIRQEEENRYCLHLLYASPVKRGNTEVIEDLPPIYDVGVTIRTSKKICRVAFPLTGEELPFALEDSKVRFTVPRFACHTVITVEYEN